MTAINRDVPATGFELSEATRVLFGTNALDELGAIARDLGGTRALIVTDPGIEATGMVDRAEALLAAAGIAHARFDGVRPNPTTHDVSECLSVARSFEPDLFIGLGGGSSIDTAKGANFLLTNGGELRDYWSANPAGSRPVTVDLLPTIAIPTTAGTGTDVQRYALIADKETRQKMACGHPSAAPRVSLLDPVLTLTVPPFVTACTGLDAIAHAVETMVTKKRTSLSDTFARAALRLAVTSFPRVLEAPDDLVARGDMLRASSLAGLAIENSMLGAAHAMANPLTAIFGVPHGQAVALMLPAVVRFNALDTEACRLYADLARHAGIESIAEDADGPELSARGHAEALAKRLEEFLTMAGFQQDLSGFNIGFSDCKALATSAAQQWTAAFNPREILADGFEQLFRTATSA